LPFKRNLQRYSAGLGVSCSADRQINAKITAEGVFVEALEVGLCKFANSVDP
jgi:fumarate hydratase class I